MNPVSGVFLNGVSSQPVAAELRAIGVGHWQVVDAEQVPLMQAEAITAAHVSSRLGRMNRTIRFAGGGMFETPDNDGVDLLLKPHKSNWHGLPHRLESGFRYVLLGLAVTLLFVYLLVQFAIPIAAEKAAFALPPQLLNKAGEETLAMLDDNLLQPSQLPVAEQERLRQMLAAFVGEASNRPIKVEFRDGGKKIGANAFALPSGTIIFTDQLLRLAENDAQILSVYAHEVGHLERRHGMRQVLQSSALVLGVTMLTGDLTSLATVATAVPVMMVMQSGYTRDFEREADRFAWQLMQEKNIPAHNFTDLLRRLAVSHGQDSNEEGDWKRYLQSHPPTQERLEAFGGAADGRQMTDDKNRARARFF